MKKAGHDSSAVCFSFRNSLASKAAENGRSRDERHSVDLLNSFSSQNVIK